MNGFYIIVLKCFHILEPIGLEAQTHLPYAKIQPFYWNNKGNKNQTL